MPQRRDDTGMAPARRRISSWTGVHCTHVIPKPTNLLPIDLFQHHSKTSVNIEAANHFPVEQLRCTTSWKLAKISLKVFIQSKSNPLMVLEKKLNTTTGKI
jgi:hypothetical protein